MYFRPFFTVAGAARYPRVENNIFLTLPEQCFLYGALSWEGRVKSKKSSIRQKRISDKSGLGLGSRKPAQTSSLFPRNPPPTYPKEPLRQKRGAIKEGKFSLFTTFLLPFHSVASSSSPPNEKGSWVQQPAVERKEEKRSGKVPGSRPFPATSCNEEEEKWVGQLLFFFFGPAHEPSSPALGGGIPPPYLSSSERPPKSTLGAIGGEKEHQ